MNAVSFAPRRPISLVVAVVAVVQAGFLAIPRIPRDIFPDLGVPTIYVAQTYGGMDPVMEGFSCLHPIQPCHGLVHQSNSSGDDGHLTVVAKDRLGGAAVFGHPRDKSYRS
jgi:hypothetical protein